MRSRWRLGELTRQEIVSKASEATVVLPLGSTEQHGDHLPICTDTFLVSTIADRAAERASAESSVLVAPALCYGFAHHHLEFGATLSVPMMTYLQLLTDVAAGLARCGFRRIVLLNGHGGNESVGRAVADRLVYEVGLAADVAATAYWTLARDALAAAVHGHMPVPGHAGSFETSMLLALRPDLVRLGDRPQPELAPRPIASSGDHAVHVRRHGAWSASGGRSDDAQLADAALGERFLEIVVSSVADFLVGFDSGQRR